MRAIMFISGTVVLMGLGGLLIWRPAMMLGLAILGGGLNLWRMYRPHKHHGKPPTAQAKPPCTVVMDDEPETAPAHELVASEIVMPALTAAPALAPQPYADLLARMRSSGWAVHAAQSPFPWLIAVNAGVRVALRPRPIGGDVSGEDLFAAMEARAADGAQFVAILSEKRPSDTIARLAKANRIHIVNMARLEAYLALALSFKQPAAKAPAPMLRPALAV